ILTPNVGHGHAVAGCGNASASAARASVPSAPPAKIAAISRRSARGSKVDAMSEQYEVLAVRYGTRQASAAEVFLNYHAYHEPDRALRMDYFFWVARNA